MRRGAQGDERIFLVPNVVAPLGGPNPGIETIGLRDAAGLRHFAFPITDGLCGQRRYCAHAALDRYPPRRRLGGLLPCRYQRLGRWEGKPYFD